MFCTLADKRSVAHVYHFRLKALLFTLIKIGLFLRTFEILITLKTVYFEIFQLNHVLVRNIGLGIGRTELFLDKILRNTLVFVKKYGPTFRLGDIFILTEYFHLD